jgi:hypothetical protein
MKAIKHGHLLSYQKEKMPLELYGCAKVKLNPKGEIARHKARLVAKGFLQKEGIDFEEVHTLVARVET